MSRRKHKQGGKKVWLAGAVAAVLLTGLWHIYISRHWEADKQWRQQLRETVKETFPEHNANYSQAFGLSLYESGQTTPCEGSLAQKNVVLVHGLDDPGKVWQNLAPELTQHHYCVWLMHYPNDQPISESAQLFFKELTRLKALSIHRIAIVTHSMGGLVSRELLTHPDIAYLQSVQQGRVPAVSALIMVGTPNHGSQMARFRVLGEIRDQFTRLTKGEGSFLGAIFDGAGEAKIDLLPGSRFLTELNARPHPEGVDLLIIAGVLSPWNEADVRLWVDGIRQRLPQEQYPKVDLLGDYMISMSQGLGDGLVTVASTRLEGVDHKTVAGSHLSMIRNITQSSRRIPPAIPIIVDRLNGKDEK